MFLDETVLVLGAGSSLHYGYPTGDGLIENIKSTINNVRFDFGAPRYGQERTEYLYQIDHSYKLLFEKLDFFDPLSIDTFLSWISSDSKLVEAGKRIIAYEIATSEDPEKLKSSYRNLPPNVASITPAPRGNWYRFLWHALISPTNEYRTVSDVVANMLETEIKLKIITFNYDISLDYYLHSRIKDADFLGDRKDSFSEKIKRNILHIYGQIGGAGRNLEQEEYGQYYSKGGDQNATVKQVLALNRVQQWKDNIHVMGKDREKEEVVKAANTAREWLRKAKRIFFLGYGFNDDNNELLDLSKICNSVPYIFLTNYGDSPHIRNLADTLFRLYKSDTTGLPNELPRSHPYQTEYLQRVSTRGVYEALEHEFNLI